MKPNKNEVANTEEKSLQLSEFFDIARTIASTSDVDSVLKKIGATAEKLTQTKASSILLLDDDKKNLYFKVASPGTANILKKIKIPVSEGIVGWVAVNKKPLIVQDVTKDARFTGKVDSASGFKTKAILCVPLIVNEELIGVAEVLNKTDGSPFTENDEEIMVGLSGFAAVAIVNAKHIADQQNFFANIFEILTRAVESIDPRFSGHSFRLAKIATAIAKKLGVTGQEYKDIYYAAILHDIGFINEPERTIVEHGTDKGHALDGYEMIKNINLLKGAAVLIKYHAMMYHEPRLNASGLKEEQIPLGSRIIGFVEAVEDMRFSVFSDEKIRQTVESQKGIKFDPVIADIYLKIKDNLS